MRHLHKLACFFTILTLGCVERYNFIPEDPVSLLVIDGSIHQGKGPYEVRLSRTSAFGSAPFSVSDAQVTLFDDLGNQERYEEGLEFGVYEGGFEMQGQPGRTYYIEVVIRGNTYRSQPQKMPSPIRADSAYFETLVEPVVSEEGNVTEDRLIKVYVDTPTRQGEGNVWLRWKYDVNYAVFERDCGPLDLRKTCYVTEITNTQDILLYSSENTNANQLNGFLITTEDTYPRYAFSTRHYFNIYQHATTLEAYEYWQKVRRVANQVGSVFDAPPAAVPGNLYNVNDADETVLGFFEATAIDTVRTFMTRGDLAPLVVSEFCGFAPNSQPPNREACCECLLLENTTLERPDYWNE